jgi:RHS repeat-associated protein
LWWAQIEYFPEQKYTRYTEGENATWEFHYDADGVVTKIVDPYGGVKVRERDDQGRLGREVDSGGRVLRWLYDSNGAHVARVDRFGNVFPPESEMPRLPDPFERTLPSTSLGFLFAGLLEPSAEAPFGVDPPALAGVPPEFTAQAQACFRLRDPRQQDAPQLETRVERDALGRPIRELDPLGRTRQWQYDATGNVVATRDRDGQVSSREITSWNLLGATRDAVGNGLRYRYSKLEQVTAVEDPLGNETRYEYDLKERLVRVHRGGGLRDEYVFDEGDHFIEKRDSSGAVLFKNEIHENHFVAVRQLASGGFHRYDYDTRGRIVEASTQSHEVRLAYDGTGATLLDLCDGVGVQHSQVGRKRSTRILDAFELTAASSDGRTELVGPTGNKTALTLEPRGLVQRICSNGTVELLQYDANGRLEARMAYKRNARGRATAWSTRYSYSAEGDLLQAADSLRGTTFYEVDAAHQLVGEVTPHGEQYAYRRDAAGNLLAKPGLGGMRLREDNRLDASVEEAFEHDVRGRLVERRRRDGSMVRYSYDSFDVLIGAERTDPEAAAQTLWRASYDAIGRRIVSSCGDQERRFYWDGDRLAAELFPSGQLRVYQYGARAALVPLGFVDYGSSDADPASGRSYHVFSNSVGMPLCIEDERGEVVWWADRVDPYGSVEVRAGATVEYNLRWPGHYYDPETGLHYNRYRYYDPRLGRYLTCDPLGYEGSPVNLYAYCPNPLTHVDVLGLHPDDVDGAPGSKKSSSADNDGAEKPPKTAAEKRAELAAKAKQRERARLLDEAVAKADRDGARDGMSKADSDFLDADPRNARLAVDADGNGKYRIDEAKTALAAEQNGQITPPAERAMRKVDPSESGGDIVDGSGKTWDHKSASMGSDDIAKTANAKENVMVDTAGMSDAEVAALEADTRSKLAPDAADVIFVRRPN